MNSACLDALLNPFFYLIQYLVWALDVRYFAPAIVRSLPKNDEGEKIRKELLRQFEDVLENGVTYELNGKTITEKHYDFALIEDLQDYVDNHDNRTDDERAINS